MPISSHYCKKAIFFLAIIFLGCRGEKMKENEKWGNSNKIVKDKDSIQLLDGNRNETISNKRDSIKNILDSLSQSKPELISYYILDYLFAEDTSELKKNGTTVEFHSFFENRQCFCVFLNHFVYGGIHTNNFGYILSEKGKLLEKKKNFEFTQGSGTPYKTLSILGDSLIEITEIYLDSSDIDILIEKHSYLKVSQECKFEKIVPSFPVDSVLRPESSE